MKLKATQDIASGKGIIKKGKTFNATKKWGKRLIEIGKAEKIKKKEEKTAKKTKEEKVNYKTKDATRGKDNKSSK